MERRTIAAVVMVVLLCGLLSVPLRAKAVETVDTWDGTADTSWYTENPNATEFTISTAEELAGLTELSTKDNTWFHGTTIALTSDIDISGHEWTPKVFCGTLDGGGHTISGLTITTLPDSSSVGLFDQIGINQQSGTYSGVVKNLSLSKVNIATNGDGADTGAIAGFVRYDSQIINCSTSGVIHVNNDWVIGVGGIAGMVTSDVQIIGCSSLVNILCTNGNEGGVFVGGLVGRVDFADTVTSGKALISDCYFDGSIQLKGEASYVGGLIGVLSRSKAGYPPESAPLAKGRMKISNCLSNPTELGSDSTDSVIAEIAPVSDVAATDAQEQPVLTVESSVWRTGQTEPVLLFDEEGNEVALNTSSMGQAVEDFSSSSLLEQLNAHASQDVTWVAGVDGHPVFSWQKSLALADYSAVTTALAGIPADLSLYTDESVAALNTVKNSVVENLPVSRQGEVAKMAADITAAISDLTYKPADYTAVKEAIAKASALVRSNYVDLSDLDAALAAVVEGKNITEQAAVTKMAADIEAALNVLELKPADYTAVKAALDKAAALNRDDYVDFSQVDAAVKAVVEGKDITEQADVDAMAQAIEDAVAALEKKPAPKPEPEPEPQPVVHTVTFVWGGKAADVVVKVEDGKQITAPTDAPELEGYSFTDAWYLTRAEDGTLSDEYNFSNPVTSDLTLYAGWIADQIPVDPEGGESADSEDKMPDGSNDKVSEVKPTSPKLSAVPETSDASLAAQAFVLLTTGAVALAVARHIGRRTP